MSGYGGYSGYGGGAPTHGDGGQGGGWRGRGRGYGHSDGGQGHMGMGGQQAYVPRGGRGFSDRGMGRGGFIPRGRGLGPAGATGGAPGGQQLPDGFVRHFHVIQAVDLAEISICVTTSLFRIEDPKMAAELSEAFLSSGGTVNIALAIPSLGVVGTCKMASSVRDRATIPMEQQPILANVPYSWQHIFKVKEVATLTVDLSGFGVPLSVPSFGWHPLHRTSERSFWVTAQAYFSLEFAVKCINEDFAKMQQGIPPELMTPPNDAAFVLSSAIPLHTTKLLFERLCSPETTDEFKEAILKECLKHLSGSWKTETGEICQKEELLVTIIFLGLVRRTPVAVRVLSKAIEEDTTGGLASAMLTNPLLLGALMVQLMFAPELDPELQPIWSSVLTFASRHGPILNIRSAHFFFVTFDRTLLKLTTNRAAVAANESPEATEAARTATTFAVTTLTFLLHALGSNFEKLSVTHNTSRAVQRFIPHLFELIDPSREDTSPELKQTAAATLVRFFHCLNTLSCDPAGNYVVQAATRLFAEHLQRFRALGLPLPPVFEECFETIKTFLTTAFSQLATNKQGSNTAECFVKAFVPQRGPHSGEAYALISDALGALEAQPTVAQDQFGNYVAQRILERCGENPDLCQRAIALDYRIPVDIHTKATRGLISALKYRGRGGGMDSGYNRNYGGPSHGGQGWEGGQYGGMPSGPGGYVQQGGHETHSIDALFGIPPSH